jgi:hypothetical protein
VAEFATYSQIQPATGLSVVVLSNLDNRHPGRIANTLTKLAGT